MGFKPTYAPSAKNDIKALDKNIAKKLIKKFDDFVFGFDFEVEFKGLQTGKIKYMQGKFNLLALRIEHRKDI